MWSFSLFALLSLMIPYAYGSAIPMWEYLSRGEKMNHLFNLFVRQVEKHCSGRAEPDCSKLLLVYGLTNLAKMEDESLDDMDPYQRGANEIVWDSMMKGTSKNNQILDFATKELPRPSPEKNNESDSMGPEPGSLEAASNPEAETAAPEAFLVGPMVVRLLPNGMPVPGEKNHLPKDEDAEEFEPSKFRRLLQGDSSSGSASKRASPPSEEGIYDNVNRSKINDHLNPDENEKGFGTRWPIYATRS